jgi:hypothetical protein
MKGMRFRERPRRGLLEYGLIIGVVAMVAVGAVLAFGSSDDVALNALLSHWGSYRGG